MFKTLVSINLAAMLEQSTKSRAERRLKLPPAILFGLAISLVIVSFYFSFGDILFKPLLYAVAGTPLHGLYWSVTAILATAMGIVVMLFMSGPIMFAAKDNERLLAMPIPPFKIVLARFAGLYLFSLIVFAVMLVPAVLVHAIEVGMSTAGLLILAAAYLFLPLLALSVATLLGILLHLVSSRIERFRTVITLVLALAAMGGYFYLIGNVQHAMTQMIAEGEAVQRVFQRVLPFFYHMGEAVALPSLLSLLRYMLWSVIPAAAVIALVSALFLPLVRRAASAKTSVFKGVKATSKGIMPALVGRELRHYAAAPMVMLNTGISAVMLLALSGWLLISEDITLLLNSLPELAPYMPGSLLVIVLFMASTSLISASLLSLEGKTIWQLKTLPVSPARILWSKVLFHWLMLCLPYLLFSLVVLFTFGGSPLMALAFILLPQLVLLVFGQIGIVFNLRFPRFDYLNETAVVKQSVSVLLTMLTGFALSAAIVAGYLLAWRRVGTLDAYVYAVTALFMLLAIVFGIVIGTWGAKRFERLQVP